MGKSRYLSAVLLLFSLNFILLRTTANASTNANLLWSDSTQASAKVRHFSEAFREGGVWVLKIYSQQYGEYQELQENRSFSDETALTKYIESEHPTLKKVDLIYSWPIKPERSFKKRNSYLWVVKNQWSVDWENRYANWIQYEVGPDFFNKNGIATDCADVLVGLRWIFARNNALPVANTLGATGDLFTHDSVLKAWRNLDRADLWNRDALFKAALNYIMGVTSTRTLIHDSYPVSLTTEGLLAGNFILTLGAESNHVKVLSENHFNDPSEIPLYTLSSTTPRSRKDMVREAMLDEEWPKKGVKNFLALRWPIQSSKGNWYLKKATEHSNYSEEQYDEDLGQNNPSFIDFLLKRLKPEFSPRRIIEIGVTELKEYLQMRASVVVGGYEYCQTHNCSQGSSGWDDWSTPSRDHKIELKFDNYEVMLARYEELYPGLLENWKNALKGVDVEILGESVPLSAIRYIWKEKLFSSDPTVAPLKRWGMEFSSFFETVVSSLRSLLSDRDNLLNSSEGRCDFSSCYPKNSLWLSLNSFHVDRDLLELNSKVRSYCSELATASCFKARDQVLKTLISTSFDERSALSWLTGATRYNSSPSKTLAERWGQTTLNLVDLKKFSSVKIAENSLALLDSKDLIDLKTNKLISSSSTGERSLLTRQGHALVTPTQGSNLKILYARQTNWSNLNLSNELGVDYDWNKASLRDISNGSVLILPREQGALLLILKGENPATLLSTDSSFVKVSPEAILFQNDAQKLSLYVLDNGHILNFSYSDRKIKNPELLELKGRVDGNFIAQYSDQNEDIYYPVIFSVNGLNLIPIESLAKQCKLAFLNSSTGSGVVESEFNSEFPKLIGFNLKNLEVVKKILLGNIVSAYSADYILTGKGGKWDHDYERSLYKATQNGWVLIKSDSTGSKLMDLAGSLLLTMKGNAEYGELSNLNNGMSIKSANFMKLSQVEGEKSVLMKSSDSSVVLGRFSSYMGDYMGYGEIYKVESGSAPRLVFTSAFAKRDEDESQLQWESRFKTSLIYSGTLVSTGIGLATWIPSIK